MKQNPHTTPEAYFSDLKTRLRSIPEMQEVPTGWQRVRPHLAMAAAFLAIVAVGTAILRNTAGNPAVASPDSTSQYELAQLVRTSSPYLYDEDANGSFYIRNSDNIENDRLTDYVMVHFQLMCPQPVEGDVYLNGVWTNDQFLPEYLMEYDEATKSYQASILLKMGYYSYQYLMVDSEGYTQVMPTEGNFFQTENKYQALVYYREPGGRTDLLVGYQQVQTR